MATFRAIKPRLFGFLGFTAFNKCPKLLEGIVVHLLRGCIDSDSVFSGDFNADNAAGL